MASDGPASTVTSISANSPNCFAGKFNNPLEKKTLKEPYLTIEQVRLAASAWITAQKVKPSVQYHFFQKVVDVITYHQIRNRDARVSHWKKTIKKLEALGININEIPSCMPVEI